MKFTQRLDYNRLAEVLAEREMAAVSAIQELLQASNEGGQPFPEALVTANLVADWDLSRVVCEVFHLPFLPLDQMDPDKELLELFHPQLLHNTGLVPISRYGNVLTVAMPGLVAAETLAMLSAETDMILLPIVGTVTSNRKWLGENCQVQKFTEDNTWGSLFDEGDAAVRETLDDEEPSDTEGLFSMGDVEMETEDPSIGEDSGLDLDTAAIEFDTDTVSDLDDVPSLMSEDIGEELGEVLGGDFELESPVGSDEDPGDSLDLPPMPDFQ